MVVQRGAKLAIRPVPAPGAQLAMDLTANGRILTGTWAEQTRGRWPVSRRGLHGRDPDDRGQQPGSQTLRWQIGGFGKDGEMNTGPWSLTLVEQHLGEQAVERWNREPE
jgi:hypothetical protein